MPKFKIQNPRFMLHEWIFIFAGAATILAMPFLASLGFSAWIAVKSVYFTGLLVLFLRR